MRKDGHGEGRYSNVHPTTAAQASGAEPLKPNTCDTQTQANHVAQLGLFMKESIFANERRPAAAGSGVKAPLASQGSGRARMQAMRHGSRAPQPRPHHHAPRGHNPLEPLPASTRPSARGCLSAGRAKHVYTDAPPCGVSPQLPLRKTTPRCQHGTPVKVQPARRLAQAASPSSRGRSHRPPVDARANSIQSQRRPHPTA